MKIQHILLYLFLFIFLSNLSLALGIGPVQQYEIFESGNSKAMSFFVFNNENKDMIVEVFADGELAKYIKFNQDEYEITKDDESIIVNYMLNYPTELPPGSHYVDLVVTEKSKNDSATVVALQSQILKLRIQVPYADDYAETKMKVTTIGSTTRFDIDFYNFGKYDVTADAIIDIFKDNLKIKSLIIDPQIIYSMQQGTLSKSINLVSGEYLAKALVYYEKNTIKLEKTFIVGQPDIEIVDITVNEFKINEVARINIMLKNNWQGVIENIYGNVIIYKDNQEIKTIPTETFNIDKTKNLAVFCDTKDMEKGTYLAKVDIIYGSQKSSNDFEIIIKSSEDLTDESKISNGKIIIIFVLFILFSVLIYLLWKLFKK